MVTFRMSPWTDLAWRPAPPAEVVTTRANVAAATTLEALIAAADRRAAEGPPAGRDEPDAGRPAAVDEGELLPLRHRRTIRRYFELIRPTEGQPPGESPAAP